MGNQMVSSELLFIQCEVYLQCWLIVGWFVLLMLLMEAVISFYDSLVDCCERGWCDGTKNNVLPRDQKRTVYKNLNLYVSRFYRLVKYYMCLTDYYFDISMWMVKYSTKS